MTILCQYISRELLELEIAQHWDSDGINITQLWSWSQYDSTITHLAPVIVGECNIEILIVLLSPSSSYDHFKTVHFHITSRARDCTTSRWWWYKYHPALILITVRQYNYPPSSSDSRRVLYGNIDCITITHLKLWSFYISTFPENFSTSRLHTVEIAME